MTGSLVSFIFNNQALYKCIRDPPRNSSSSCLKVSLNTIHSSFSSSWSEKEFYHLDIRSLLILIEVPDMALPPRIAEQPLAAWLPLHTGQVFGGQCHICKIKDTSFSLNCPFQEKLCLYLSNYLSITKSLFFFCWKFHKSQSTLPMCSAH